MQVASLRANGKTSKPARRRIKNTNSLLLSGLLKYRWRYLVHNNGETFSDLGKRLFVYIKWNNCDNVGRNLIIFLENYFNFGMTLISHYKNFRYQTAPITEAKYISHYKLENLLYL